MFLGILILFPVFGGGHPIVATEGADKVFGVGIAYLCADHIDFFVCGGQKLYSLLHPYLGEVFGKVLPGTLLENLADIGGIHEKFFA